jgi:hypothetical protein
MDWIATATGPSVLTFGPVDDHESEDQTVPFKDQGRIHEIVTSVRNVDNSVWAVTNGPGSQ